MDKIKDKNFRDQIEGGDKNRMDRYVMDMQASIFGR